MCTGALFAIVKWGLRRFRCTSSKVLPVRVVSLAQMSHASMLFLARRLRPLTNMVCGLNAVPTSSAKCLQICSAVHCTSSELDHSSSTPSRISLSSSHQCRQTCILSTGGASGACIVDMASKSCRIDRDDRLQHEFSKLDF